jgi:hypothetical protein
MLQLQMAIALPCSWQTQRMCTYISCCCRCCASIECLQALGPTVPMTAQNILTKTLNHIHVSRPAASPSNSRVRVTLLQGQQAQGGA